MIFFFFKKYLNIDTAVKMNIGAITYLHNDILDE